MNFYNIIQNILETSKRHKNVKEVSEGDIYVYLNSGEHKYPCVFLTVGEVTDSEMTRNVNCTLFYVDRLSSDQSNRTTVQSLGITTLGDILDTIEGDVVSVNYTTFTEKFADMCAGVFATVDITYPLDEVCDEHFEVRQLEITENGIYDTIGYDEFVIEVVDEELVERVEELTANIELKEQEVEELTANIELKEQEVENLNTTIEQKDVEIAEKNVEISDLNTQISTVTSISITENGTYTPEEGVLGWNNIEVNITLDTSNLPPKLIDGMKLDNKTTSLPENLDTSSMTDMSSFFISFTNLTTIPLLDTSNVTKMGNMFSGCSSLTSVLQLNTSKVIHIQNLFGNCKSLVDVPQFNVPKATTIQSMFSGCTSLKTAQIINAYSATNAKQVFYNCTSLEEATLTQTYNATEMGRIFYGCTNLKTVNNLDMSKARYNSSCFYNCSSLENITFVGSMNDSNDFSYSPLLTYDSVKSILTACSNTTNTFSKTLQFNRTLTDQNGELAALVADCNTKKWTISGLTLN